MNIDLGAAIFVSLFICLFTLVVILCNLPRVEDWLRRILGKLPSQVDTDISEYIEEVGEFEKEEEQISY